MIGCTVHDHKEYQFFTITGPPEPPQTLTKEWHSGRYAIGRDTMVCLQFSVVKLGSGRRGPAPDLRQQSNG